MYRCRCEQPRSWCIPSSRPMPDEKPSCFSGSCKHYRYLLCTVPWDFPCTEYNYLWNSRSILAAITPESMLFFLSLWTMTVTINPILIMTVIQSNPRILRYLALEINIQILFSPMENHGPHEHHQVDQNGQSHGRYVTHCRRTTLALVWIH